MGTSNDQIYRQAIAQAVASFDRTRAPQIGAKLLEFALPNATGTIISLRDILAKPNVRGALITFYRGGWCPNCNRQLHDLQVHLKDFTDAGVRLVAVSPELPDSSLSTIEKHNLEFDVLTDKDAVYAEKLGLKWQMPESLNPILEGSGVDLRKYYGNYNRVVVVPTNILVDKDGTVKQVFAEPDWTKRLETSKAVAWAKAL